MKKFKNNKGVTGVDVALSITIIVIVLGVVLSVYSNYSNRTKQVNRNAKATNLAVKVIESIEADDDLAKEIIESTDDITITEQNKGTYGIDDLPNGYNVKISKAETTGNTALDVVATKIIVTANYNIENKEKNVSLDIIKLKNIWNKEAQEPLLDENIKAIYTPIKYDANKKGYVVTTFDDPDWYNISSKRFATGAKNIVETENGTVDLEQCTEIHVWIPGGVSEPKDNGEYYIRYVQVEDWNARTYYPIYYIIDDDTGIGYYKKSDELKQLPEDKGMIFEGHWQQLDSDLQPINVAKKNEGAYYAYMNYPFTWEEPVE